MRRSKLSDNRMYPIGNTFRRMAPGGKYEPEPEPQPVYTYTPLAVNDELEEMQPVYLKSPDDINILIHLRHLPNEATSQDGKKYKQIMKLKSVNYNHECEIGYMTLGGVIIIVDTNLDTSEQVTYYAEPLKADETGILYTIFNDYDFPPSLIVEDLGGLEFVFKRTVS